VKPYVVRRLYSAGDPAQAVEALLWLLTSAPLQLVDEEADPGRPAASLIREGLGDGTPTASP
jgi:hypothetical protein